MSFGKRTDFSKFIDHKKKVYKCPHCSKEYELKQVKAFRLHFHSHHKSVTKITAKNFLAQYLDEEKASFVCPHCPKRYLPAKDAAFRLHLKYHDPDHRAHLREVSKKARKKKKIVDPDYHKRRELMRKQKDPGYLEKQNQRKKNIRAAQKASGKKYICEVCGVKKSSNADLTRHKRLVHPATEKAKADSIHRLGICKLAEIKFGSFEPLYWWGYELNLDSIPLVREVMEALGNTYFARYPHFLYRVAIVEEEAAGQFGAWLKKNYSHCEKDVEIYVGINHLQRESTYHTDIKHCHCSSINAAIAPGLGKVAILISAVEIGGGMKYENIRRARNYEAQLQIMLQAYGFVKKNDMIKLSRLNRKTEEANAGCLSIEEVRCSEYLGAVGVPPIIPASHWLASQEMSHPLFLGGMNPSLIIDEDFKGELIPYVQPLYGQRSNLGILNDTVLVPRPKKLFRPHKSIPGEDFMSSNLVRHLEEARRLAPNARFPKFVYQVIVVDEEAKGRFGIWLKENFKKPEKEVQIYTGVSPMDGPNPYHSDPKSCHTSTVNDSIKPGSGKCAIILKVLRVGAGNYGQNSMRALAYELQLQLFHLCFPMVKQTCFLKVGRNNRKVETSSLSLLSENERKMAVALAAMGIPPILPAGYLTQSYKSPFFLGGKLEPFMEIHEDFKGNTMEYVRPLRR